MFSIYAKMFEEIYPDKKDRANGCFGFVLEDGFVQVDTPDLNIAKHQELFYKHTKDFFERNSINS